MADSLHHCQGFSIYFSVTSFFLFFSCPSSSRPTLVTYSINQSLFHWFKAFQPSRANPNLAKLMGVMKKHDLTNKNTTTKPPQFIFTLPQPSCCHHPALLPGHGVPPWDLLPPSAGPPRRVHFVLVFPPKSLPSPVYSYLGNLWLPLLVGRGFARCRLAWRFLSLSCRGWFHFFVLELSK